jgi:hypothetical protein
MFYPGENPVGQTMVIEASAWEVIGVASDVVERRPDVPPGGGLANAREVEDGSVLPW